MKKIVADVLLDIESEFGLYVSVEPDFRSRFRLKRLLSTAPFPTKSPDDLHCTLLYCESPPELVIIPEPISITSTINKVEIWNHENHVYLVFSLDSPDLCALHRQLVKQGARHSFSQYKPHSTIAHNVDIDSSVLNWISKLNASLAAYKMPINFNPVLKTAHLER